MRRGHQGAAVQWAVAERRTHQSGLRMRAVIITEKLNIELILLTLQVHPSKLLLLITLDTFPTVHDFSIVNLHPQIPPTQLCHNSSYRFRMIIHAALSILLLYTCTTQGYVLTSFSSFTGAGLLTLSRTPSSSSRSCTRATLEMKKGKSNVPVQMRGNYEKQKQILQAREAMMAAQDPKDGKPVFNLFVRSKQGAQMWYPCGSFKGDDRSAALAQSYRDGNLLASVSKNQLDSGVSNSVAQDLEKLQEQIFRAIPQLRKSKGNLEYGYRLAFEGLSEEQKKINIFIPQKREGFFDRIKGAFGQ